MNALERATRLHGADALGQLLIISPEDDRWTPAAERLIRLYRPGGILLTERNLRTAEATARMLAKMSGALGTLPFLALEEEGGDTDPLRAFFPPLPSPRVAAKNGNGAVRRLGELAGQALRLLGFNLNLAPRLDLQDPHTNPLHDRQTFSNDPHKVTKYAKAFISGLRRQKVAPCGKEFPGIGAAEFRWRETVPRVGKAMAELWRQDLVPFRQLLPCLPLVKVTHAAYKAYDFDAVVPAALSSNILMGLLRAKLGYRGVTVAELLESVDGRRTTLSHSTEALVKSFNAGCDMQIIRAGGKTAELMAATLSKALACGTLSPRRVEEALKHIARAKKGIHAPTGGFSSRAYDRLVRDFEDFGKIRRNAGDDID